MEKSEVGEQLFFFSVPLLSTPSEERLFTHCYMRSLLHLFRCSVLFYFVFVVFLFFTFSTHTLVPGAAFALVVIVKLILIVYFSQVLCSFFPCVLCLSFCVAALAWCLQCEIAMTEGQYNGHSVIAEEGRHWPWKPTTEHQYRNLLKMTTKKQDTETPRTQRHSLGYLFTQCGS